MVLSGGRKLWSVCGEELRRSPCAVGRTAVQFPAHEQTTPCVTALHLVQTHKPTHATARSVCSSLPLDGAPFPSPEWCCLSPLSHLGWWCLPPSFFWCCHSLHFWRATILPRLRLSRSRSSSRSFWSVAAGALMALGESITCHLDHLEGHRAPYPGGPQEPGAGVLVLFAGRSLPAQLVVRRSRVRRAPCRGPPGLRPLSEDFQFSVGTPDLFGARDVRPSWPSLVWHSVCRCMLSVG